MEYFVVLLNNKPVKVVATLLDAMLFVSNREAVIHRIHHKDDKLVVQEIMVDLESSSLVYPTQLALR
jgi:hypothetical protein